MLAVLALAQIEARVGEYNSACWADVAKGKDVASMTLKGVTIACGGWLQRLDRFKPWSDLWQTHI